jgi:hypothetical protein
MPLTTKRIKEMQHKCRDAVLEPDGTHLMGRVVDSGGNPDYRPDLAEFKELLILAECGRAAMDAGFIAPERVSENPFHATKP